MDKGKRNGILCLFALVCVAILLSTSLMVIAGNNNDASKYARSSDAVRCKTSYELESCMHMDSDGYIVAVYDETQDFIGEKERLGELIPSDMDVKIGRLTYKPHANNTVSVIDYEGSYRNIVVPDKVEFDDKTWIVTEIDDWGLSTGPFGRYPRSVEIGPLVETLDDHSINGQWCSGDGLTDFSIRNIKFSRLTTIGEQAFDGTYLTTIELPRGLKVIGDCAFRGCCLEIVNLLSDSLEIGNSAFADNPLYRINLEKVSYIGAGAFRGTQLGVVDLSSATEIGFEAFASDDLHYIKFSSELTSLNGKAFVGIDGRRYHFYDIYYSELDVCAENMCGKSFQWWGGDSRDLIENII